MVLSAHVLHVSTILAALFHLSKVFLLRELLRDVSLHSILECDKPFVVEVAEDLDEVSGSIIIVFDEDISEEVPGLELTIFEVKSPLLSSERIEKTEGKLVEDIVNKLSFQIEFIMESLKARLVDRVNLLRDKGML
jgi:hypothetical protein